MFALKEISDFITFEKFRIYNIEETVGVTVYHSTT